MQLKVISLHVKVCRFHSNCAAWCCFNLWSFSDILRLIIAGCVIIRCLITAKVVKTCIVFPFRWLVVLLVHVSQQVGLGCGLVVAKLTPEPGKEGVLSLLLKCGRVLLTSRLRVCFDGELSIRPWRRNLFRKCYREPFLQNVWTVCVSSGCRGSGRCIHTRRRGTYPLKM